MDNSILIIEDDEGKLQDLSQHIQHEFPKYNVIHARSYQSGLKSIVDNKSTLNFIILDMTMPCLDISINEPYGGGMENFAGKLIMAQMNLRGILIPTIVVTMYDNFGEPPHKVSLTKLIEELNNTLSPPFHALVYYNAQQEGWRSSLTQTIKGLQ